MKSLIVLLISLKAVASFASPQNCEALISNDKISESLTEIYGLDVTKVGDEYFFESGAICTIIRSKMENNFLFSSDPVPGQVAIASCTNGDGSEQVFAIDFHQTSISGFRMTSDCHYSANEILINY